MKPLRIKIVDVKRGDTVEKLAMLNSGVVRGRQLFLALNGLQAGESLKPGDKVKIVTE